MPLLMGFPQWYQLLFKSPFSAPDLAASSWPKYFHFPTTLWSEHNYQMEKLRCRAVSTKAHLISSFAVFSYPASYPIPSQSFLLAPVTPYRNCLFPWPQALQRLSLLLIHLYVLSPECRAWHIAGTQKSTQIRSKETTENMNFLCG